MGHTGATNANRAEQAEASSSRERSGERGRKAKRKAEGNVYAKDAIKNRRVSRGLPSQCDIFAFNFISLNTLQRRRAVKAGQGRREGGAT